MILTRNDKLKMLFFFFLRVFFILSLNMGILTMLGGILFLGERRSRMMRTVKNIVPNMEIATAKCINAVSSYWRLSSF